MSLKLIFKFYLDRSKIFLPHIQKLFYYYEQIGKNVQTSFEFVLFWNILLKYFKREQIILKIFFKKKN